MAKRSALHMTAAAAAEHQRRHGFVATAEAILGKPLQPYQREILGGLVDEKPPKPRMNKTETEYSLILEARKRRCEIRDYRFEGMSLSWGIAPDTKKPMWYTGDFVVWPVAGVIELHEVKGGHIFEKDRIRFKGCRAEWGAHFRFVMMQKKEGVWRKIH
jgi:hypothetical protein